MKKRLWSCGLLSGILLLSGCIIPTKGTSVAFITLDHVSSAPFVDNSVNPTKRGDAKSTGVLLFNTGDASIGTAMRNGGITKVHHVDYSVKNFLYFYNETLTIVYGE
jgi:hypothetical protein